MRDDAKYLVQVNGLMTTEEFRVALMNQDEIPSGRQHLILEGEELGDDRTLQLILLHLTEPKRTTVMCNSIMLHTEAEIVYRRSASTHFSGPDIPMYGQDALWKTIQCASWSSHWVFELARRHPDRESASVSDTKAK